MKSIFSNNIKTAMAATLIALTFIYCLILVNHTHITTMSPFILGDYGHAAAVSGAPVDPRYGQLNTEPFGGLGYDRAREIANSITFAVFLICCFMPIDKRMTTKRTLIKLVGSSIVVIAVHATGFYFTNNFGGLGGGGV